MPQCVKMKAVFGKPRLAHQFVEYRARAVVGAQFALFGAEYQIIVVRKGDARFIFHFPSSVEVFFQAVYQNLGHRHAAHACRRLGVRNHRFVVGNAPSIVVVRNDGYGVVHPNRLVGKIYIAPAERKHLADAQPRKERCITYML